MQHPAEPSPVKAPPLVPVHPDARRLNVGPGKRADGTLLNGAYGFALSRLGTFGMDVRVHDHGTPHITVAVLRVLDGQIIGVEVRPSHRRRGIATAMFALACANTDHLVAHSPDRTMLGEAWARAVTRSGEAMPEQNPDYVRALPGEQHDLLMETVA